MRDRIDHAHRAAVAHLLDLRQDEGRWLDPKDVYALTGALYILLLRTTGLIEQPGAWDREARLVRHMLHQVGADGGFYKYPSSPSNKAITRLVVATLELVLGSGPPPGHRPPAWFCRNPSLSEQDEDAIEATLDAALRFLESGEEHGSFAFRYDHLVIFEKLLLAYLDPRRPVPLLPPLEPRTYTFLTRTPWLRDVLPHFSFMLRQLLPAASVLYRRARGRNARFFPFRASSRRRLLQEMSLRELAQHILETQGELGGWFYNTVYTCMNLMALVETGVPLNHPAVMAGMAYLHQHLLEANAGGLFVHIMDSDLWDTALALTQLLEQPARSAMDRELRTSLELLLHWEGTTGGFAWGLGDRRFTDNDSTAIALLAIAEARRTAQGPLEAACEAALERGVSYLLAHQNQDGGWGVWERTFKRSRPGHVSFTHQALFDAPTADVTGRVLQALAACGFTLASEPVRSALGFLRKMQSPNGAWWCRWWSAYVPGTNYVLRGLADLGVRDTSVDLALGFLEAAQRADGGWGETTDADTGPHLAGAGPSTPLHTADTLQTLLKCGYPRAHPSVERGFRYLLDAQVAPGVWRDTQVAFTFYAGTFYYPYPMWNAILPLAALTAYRRTDGV